MDNYNSIHSVDQILNRSHAFSVLEIENSRMSGEFDGALLLIEGRAKES